MILTLTCNLLGEITGHYDQLHWGKTQRARQTSFQVGGKGINVAKMAHRLGYPARSLYFSGGGTGALCDDWLAKQAFPSQRLPLSGETRLGWVARTTGQRETTFLGADVPLSREAWGAALDAVVSEKQVSWLALCGSIPGWQPDFAEDLAARWDVLQARGCRIALDTYGSPLADLCRLPFDLVKINADELATLPGAQDGGDPATRLVSQSLSSPVRSWIITDGPGRVFALEKPGATVLELHPPVVEEVSPVGCGDVLLASYLVARERGLGFRQALEAALPLASANAAHPGVAEFALPPVWP